MYKLAIPPDSAAYTVTDGNEVLSVQLDGGFSRYRKDKVGTAARAIVSWTVGPSDYDYLRAFYNVVGRNGARFAVDLVFDLSKLLRYEAYFVPGRFGLKSQEGQVYVVEAEIEVIPQAGNLAEDIRIVEDYSFHTLGASPRQLVVTDANNKLDVLSNPGAVSYTATIPVGTYRSPKHLARAINNALYSMGWSSPGWNVCVVGTNGLDGNSSFETGTAGWSGYNNSSGLEPGTLTRYRARLYDPPPNGKYYARYEWYINNTTTKGLYCGLGNNCDDGMPIFPGWVRDDWNILRFKARASSTNIGRTLALAWNAGPNFTVTVANPPLTGTWQTYEFRVRWTTNPMPSAELHITINGSTSGRLEFDDMQLFNDNPNEGRIIISGNSDFDLPFLGGPNQATSIRDLIGFGSGDYSNLTKYVAPRPIGDIP